MLPALRSNGSLRRFLQRPKKTRSSCRFVFPARASNTGQASYIAHQQTIFNLGRLFACSLRLVLVLVLPLSFGAKADAQKFHGFTEPQKTIDLSSPESGQIEKLSIELGDTVLEGLGENVNFGR